MRGRRYAIPKLQSNMYRDAYRRTLIWLILSVFVMGCLVCAILYFVLAQPSARYFATTTDGKIIPMKVARYG